jgi:hypothetical protein
MMKVKKGCAPMQMNKATQLNTGLIEARVVEKSCTRAAISKKLHLYSKAILMKYLESNPSRQSRGQRRLKTKVVRSRPAFSRMSLEALSLTLSTVIRHLGRIDEALLRAI